MLAVTALPVEVCRKSRESGKGDQVIEKHYTINELAELLTMSFERMRQLVMDEPGVLRIAPKTQGERRGRTMYRIPESVVQRILPRSANPAS